MNHKESAAKHTPEPWKIEDHYHYKVNIIEENDPIDRVIASLGHFPEDIDYPADIAIANSRRLVACVNACAGIPTEALECQTKKELTKKLIDTNKELLAALEEAFSFADAMLFDGTGGDPFPFQQVTAAIKKAKEVFND
jgi:hypothetical protein